MWRAIRLIGKPLWIAGFLFTLGCGGPAMIPGTGSITLDGKPLAGVEIQFVPDPDKGPGGETATGQSDAKGGFTLKSNRIQKDGIVAGVYRVVITDIQSVPDLTSTAALGTGPGVQGQGNGENPNRIQPIYTDLKRTPLRDIQVQPGSGPISLKLSGADPLKPRK